MPYTVSTTGSRSRTWGFSTQFKQHRWLHSCLVRVKWAGKTRSFSWGPPYNVNGKDYPTNINICFYLLAVQERAAMWFKPGLPWDSKRERPSYLLQRGFSHTSSERDNRNKLTVGYSIARPRQRFCSQKSPFFAACMEQQCDVILRHQ